MITNGIQSSSSDHEYTSEPISFPSFVASDIIDEFDMKFMMTNFWPTSADTERVFSLARISKNFWKIWLTPDNHSRTVFLEKYISLLS